MRSHNPLTGSSVRLPGALVRRIEDLGPTESLTAWVVRAVEERLEMSAARKSGGAPSFIGPCEAGA